MKDINLSLRQAYYSLINGQITVNSVVIPIYYLQVPDNYPSLYIVIQSINSTGIETKCSQDVDTSIQFAFCSRLERNSGWEVDQMAGQFYNLVYPNRRPVVSGVLSIDIINDNTIGGLDSGGVKQVVERIVTLNNIITI